MPLPTDFAPAERAASEQIQAQRRHFADVPLLTELLDAIPTFFLVLNEQRQTVFANKAVRDVLDAPEDDLLGARPGDLFGCTHATTSPGGCGTTTFCRYCGAVQAILSALRGEETVQECRIRQEDDGALDFRVWATPISVNDALFTAVAFQDISHEKRRRALERTFFHDVLNTAGGLRGVIDVLDEVDGPLFEEFVTMAQHSADALVSEINAQRTLTAAENGDLQARPEVVISTSVLRSVQEIYERHPVARDRTLRLAPDMAYAVFTSDPALLRRVLGNLAKNGLEATEAGAVVTMGCSTDDDEITFWVHNPGHMPEKVQRQLFQRSFSTKGDGRGLGTYSIKLLTEQYLGGQVDFTSTPADGTTFTITLPIRFDAEQVMPG
ncbi:MAG: GHKL domain-containing protein [Bacteroidetes bacterium]|jgi:signal transduction histidine kinase|nr:GHKL domain-containing protein [Bacteroidota bacterium]